MSGAGFGFKRICVVCGADSDGQHFGQFTCKACAAFFRRSIVSNSAYVCKFQKLCEILKDVRNSCRHCRLQKCLDKGMIPEAVQSPSNGDIKFYPLRLRKISDNNTLNPDCSFKSLQKMVDGYRRLRCLRKSSYALFIGGSNFTTWDPQCIPQSNYSNARKCCQIEASFAHDMVKEYFEPFSILLMEDQEKLFNIFCVFFLNTEKIYNTCKAFGNIENNDKFILPDGGYAKLDEIAKFYANSDEVAADPEELARIFSASMKFAVTVIVPAMMKAGVDDYSLAAIYAISLFRDDLENISQQTRDILKSAREDVVRDLHAYFRCNKGLSDVELSLELSKILLLIPTLEHSVKIVRENFHLADLFCLMDSPKPYK